MTDHGQTEFRDGQSGQLPQGSLTLVDPLRKEMALRVTLCKDDQLFSSFTQHNHFSMLLVSKGKGAVVRDQTSYTFSCNVVLFNNLYDTPVVDLVTDEMRCLSVIADQMRRELQNRPDPDPDVLLSYLKIFLINATRVKREQQPAPAVEAGKMPSTVFSRKM